MSPESAAPWIAGLLQLSDSFYPTGSYAHSFGLEGLVQSGAVRDRSGLRDFVVGQAMPLLARTDLPVAAGAWRAAGDPPDWEALRSWCLLGRAVRGAREPREASEAIGRQRIDLCSRIRGGLAEDFRKRALEGAWPRPSCVAAAIEGRSIGAPLEAVLCAIVYAAAAGLAAASMKLLRLGQNTAQALIAEAVGLAPLLAAEALEMSPEDIGGFHPWWDIAAARHESADGRLFIS
jgi:urease accessory protein